MDTGLIGLTGLMRLHGAQSLLPQNLHTTSFCYDHQVRQPYRGTDKKVHDIAKQ